MPFKMPFKVESNAKYVRVTLGARVYYLTHIAYAAFDAEAGSKPECCWPRRLLELSDFVVDPTRPDIARKCRYAMETVFEMACGFYKEPKELEVSNEII